MQTRAEQSRDLRDMRAEIDRLRQMVGTQPSQHPRAAAGGSTSVILRPFILTTSSGADYVLGHTWDGSTEGESAIKIAKPYMLRRTPFDEKTVHGITYTYLTNIRRLAVYDTEEEYQVIVPSYGVGDMIYALSIANAYLKDPGGTTLTGTTWLDLNVCGRAWAEESE